MKIVTAYVRIECAPRLMRELHEAGVSGLTAYEVRGMSGEAATFFYSKRPYELGHLPESLKIEVICEDDSVDKIVALIAQQARTGAPGDGILAIQDVERVLRIRDIA
jgi:nitrogen regulatory protein P-II 1